MRAHRRTQAQRITLGALLSLALCASACTTAGSAWMSEPLIGGEDEPGSGNLPTPPESKQAPRRGQINARTLGSPEQREPGDPVDASKLVGKVLGTFRNTYYDFPAEGDYKGETVALKDAQCRTIKNVPKDFHDKVCVQGSGTLLDGQTVSFNRRDCECAAECPRTKQRICFDALSSTKYPWGRGATGGPITPLLTIATDTAVIPFGTSVYIPEYEGMPTDGEGTRHDGCFIAQDRGSKVKGKHVDVFAGQEAVTKVWNALVPSNSGVTVVLDSPNCRRAPTPAIQPAPPPKRDRDRERRRDD